jgi:hypothetical protein
VYGSKTASRNKDIIILRIVGYKHWDKYLDITERKSREPGEKLHNEDLQMLHSRITSIKSQSFCMSTFSARLTNLMALLPQSHYCSCYVGRRILAPPPPWLQKHTDLHAHDFAHSPDLWHRPRLANVTCAWSWRLCGINPSITFPPLVGWSDEEG